MLKTRRPRMFVARLDSRIESTPLARYLLRAYLSGLPSGLPSGDRYADTAELLLGELFANAVQHSDAPDDHPIEIRFTLVNSRLRLEVHDAGATHPALRAAAPDAEHGRGLLLVNELAERWGCSSQPDGIGKYVWAHIAPAPTPALVTA